MIVGFMRNYKQPILLAKMLSIHCKYYNIELLYFNPQDVDIDSQTINGKIFVKGNWKTVSRPIPKFIDISPYCFKYRKVVDFLKSKADLSNDYHNWLDKNLLQKILEEDNNFNHLAIPTYEPTTGEEIKNYLDNFHKIILKPTGGQEGKNVYAVIKEGVNFRLLHKSSERLLEKKEFEEFLDKEILGQEYILQKNINSLTKQGFPFD